VTDLAKNNPPLIFPHPPILASDRANWKNIYFAHFQQPPCEVPEYVLSQHMICINVGKPVQLKQAVDGQFKTVYSVPGDLGIYPAYLSQQFSLWRRSSRTLSANNFLVIWNYGCTVCQCK
jgi:AraC family transcriptional regulator